MKFRNYIKLNYKDIAVRMKNERGRWAYYTALRGPDGPGTTEAKILFQGFLRGRFKNGSDIASFVCAIKRYQVNKEIFYNNFRDGLHAEQHYLHHMTRAMIAVSNAFTDEIHEIALHLGRIATMAMSSSDHMVSFVRNMDAIVVIIEDMERKHPSYIKELIG